MQPGYGGMQGPQGGGGPIQTRGTVRNPITMFLVSSCCFPYVLFQYKQMEEELKAVAGNPGPGSILWFLFPLVPLLSMPKLIGEARAKAGTPTQGEGSLIMYLLLGPYFLTKDANEIFTGGQQQP